MLEMLKDFALGLWYSTVIVVCATFITAVILSVIQAVKSNARLDR
jgi:hypothetical protein